jgi:hypothetical protein
MSRPTKFRVISDDPDSYKLAFSVASLGNNKDILHVMSEAIHLRLNLLLGKNALKLVGASNKTDLFESFEEDSGYVEIDTVHVSETSMSFEAYLYNLNSRLKGKTSCSLFFEAC